MSKSADGHRNWSDLPSDLIGSIAELLSTVDYLRFGAVCVSWAASVSLVLPRAPQMPFLLIPEEQYTLLDLTDGRRHRRPFPELEGKTCIDFRDDGELVRLAHRSSWEMEEKMCIGSLDGWLALIDGRRRSEMNLFNPVTRSKIQLPSITTMDGVETFYNYSGSLKEYRITILDRRHPITVPSHKLRDLIKAVVFSRPTAGIAAAVMLLCIGCTTLLATATTATKKWILIRDAEPVSDIINYGGDGRFLMESNWGKLWALDVTTTGDSPKLTELTKDIEYPFSLFFVQRTYLANSNGDILLIVIDTGEAGVLVRLKIFRLESDQQQQRWVPLRGGGLGDRSLFIGPFSSFSLSAREVPELKPNCVYCNWFDEDEDEEEGKGKRRGVGRDICCSGTRRFGRFHLEDGSVDYFSYPRKPWLKGDHSVVRSNRWRPCKLIW